MGPRILLVNPPVYDFSAYDFWLRPLGLLTVAGQLRGMAEMALFDYLDRAALPDEVRARLRGDSIGRGEYPSVIVPKPAALADIPRNYRRFGRERREFREMLEGGSKFDFVLIQTGMTYWYGGVAEAIKDLRELQRQAKIVLGGTYATLCGSHAGKLGADMVVHASQLQPLWQAMGIRGDPNQPPLWEAYNRLETGALKITDGCPFRCSYCSVRSVYGEFTPRPPEQAVKSLELMKSCGAKRAAFYDDALLYHAEEVLLPLLEEMRRLGVSLEYHTPNALNARFLTRELAERLVKAGFASFFMGFESNWREFQSATGGKVGNDEFAAAVEHLRRAGIQANRIIAYIILGHPRLTSEHVEQSLRFVRSLGVRSMLAEFSPIPSTVDGEAVSKYMDLQEPLNHNKTAFVIRTLGQGEANRLKLLCKRLNSELEC